jgi:hypothetical protein
MTSNLAAFTEQPDYGQGGGGIDECRDNWPKPFVINNLTSKFLGIKILQPLLQTPRQSRLSRGGGGGVHPENTDFLE